PCTAPRTSEPGCSGCATSSTGWAPNWTNATKPGACACSSRPPGASWTSSTPTGGERGSQDVAGAVLGRLRVAGDHLLHLRHHFSDLAGRRPGERQPVGQQLLQLLPAQRQPLVGGQPVQQVVVLDPLLPHRQGDRHRVL